MKPSRRWILRGLGAGAGTLALGCPPVDDDDTANDDDSAGANDDDATGDDDDSAGGPFDGAEYLGLAALGPDASRPMDTTYGDGLDGRRYVDLADLTDDTLLLENDDFYVRTRASDLLDTAGWTLTIDGLVQSVVTLGLADVQARVSDQGAHLMECSGNGGGGRFGLLSAARWSGVSVADLLDLAGVDPAARRVRITGFDEYSTQSDFSTPGASWIFSLEQVASTAMFLATSMNGEDLPVDHGFPMRLLVPGWYGCTCIKWVTGIELVDDEVDATGQMQEFAQRTHQDGIPALARDFAPADIHQAAMPIRVEQWRTAAGTLLYRVVGVLWGGTQTTDALTIDFGDGAVPVDTYDHQSNASWTLWEHAWAPATTGTFAIAMAIDDAAIPTRRLDSGWYLRDVTIDAL